MSAILREAAKIGLRMAKNQSSRRTPMRRRPMQTKGLGSALQGEGRHYKIWRADSYLDPQIAEILGLAKAIRKRQRIAHTPSNGRTDLNNARNALRRRNQLLESIERAGRRTADRRRIDAARAATQRRRGANATRTTPSQDNGRDNERKPTPVLPPPPAVPELPPTTEPPSLPPPPFFPPWEIPYLEPVPMLPPPPELPKRKRDKDQDDPSCEELKEIARALGLPEPICGRLGKELSIRGGKNP